MLLLLVVTLHTTCWLLAPIPLPMLCSNASHQASRLGRPRLEFPAVISEPVVIYCFLPHTYVRTAGSGGWLGDKTIPLSSPPHSFLLTSSHGVSDGTP
jgi:hypothetical protein